MDILFVFKYRLSYIGKMYSITVGFIVLRFFPAIFKSIPLIIIIIIIVIIIIIIIIIINIIIIIIHY